MSVQGSTRSVQSTRLSLGVAPLCAALISAVSAGACDGGSAAVDAPKAESAKVEPAKVEPAKAEPAKVEAAKVEPAKVEAPGEVAAPTGEGAGDCQALWRDTTVSVHMMSTAVSVDSEIDVSFDLAAGRISGSAYKLDGGGLARTSPDYAATPKQVEAMTQVLKGLCLAEGRAAAEKPKRWFRYGLVDKDGSERWVVPQGRDTGLPPDTALLLAGETEFKKLTAAWPKDPAG